MEYDNGKKLVFAGDEPLKENGKNIPFQNKADFLSELYAIYTVLWYAKR